MVKIFIREHTCFYTSYSTLSVPRLFVAFTIPLSLWFIIINFTSSFFMPLLIWVQYLITSIIVMLPLLNYLPFCWREWSVWYIFILPSTCIYLFLIFWQLAMVKNQRLAEKLVKGNIYDCICKYEPVSWKLLWTGWFYNSISTKTLKESSGCINFTLCFLFLCIVQIHIFAITNCVPES